MPTSLEQARIDCPMPPPPNLPARYEKVTFKSIEHDGLRAVAAEYLQRFEELGSLGIGPVFIGRSRTYKTVAAVVLAKGIWQMAAVGVTFVDCAAWLPRMEMTRYTAESAGRVDRWSTAPVLVLDDFSVARPKSWAAEILLAVLSARFNAQRPTIITGNLELPPGAEFLLIAEQYGPAFSRRLEDGGRDFTVWVTPGERSRGVS